MQEIEYKAYIPYFYWSFLRKPKVFRMYVRSYMKMYYPDLEPVRVEKNLYVICRKKE